MDTNDMRNLNDPLALAPEAQIKDTLITLLDGIKEADGHKIASSIGKLDDQLSAHGSSLHPQLVHFLGNRSYAKALMFLEGQKGIPAGVCGGRAGQPKTT